MKYLLSLGLPLLLMAIMAIWGTFAVPNDPSRSGSAPIVISGMQRLIIELGIFVFATLMLNDLGYNKECVLIGLVIIIHYVVSYKRVCR